MAGLEQLDTYQRQTKATTPLGTLRHLARTFHRAALVPADVLTNSGIRRQHRLAHYVTGMNVLFTERR